MKVIKRLWQILLFATAIVSALVCIGASVMLWRGQSHHETWVIAPRLAPAPAEVPAWKKIYGQWSQPGVPNMFDDKAWVIDRSIESGEGYLGFLRQYHQPWPGSTNPYPTPGYGRYAVQNSPSASAGPFLLSSGAPGERGWSFMGLHFWSHPPSFSIPVTPMPRPGNLPPYYMRVPSLFSGIAEFRISWWWIILVTAIVPVVWILRWWKRFNRQRKLHSCAVCGYDLRATPDQCPECGHIPAVIVMHDC